MTDLIKVNFEAVYEKIEGLQGYVERDILEEAQSRYDRLQELLDGVDGAANAALKEAVEANRIKTRAVGGAVLGLLGYMKEAARELQAKDKHLSEKIGVREGE